jgi:predicted HAD superfamily Cof-like phosphohydrolase
MTQDNMMTPDDPNMMWDDIVEFHKKFGFEPQNEPRFLTPEENEFRVEFLIEELSEYRCASSLEDKIDALVDLVVVAMGTAYFHGFDWDSHWKEVHRANMNKVRAESAKQSKRKSSLDIVKPAGWTGPNHKQFL